jgi:regulator of ribonuclease activity A
VVDAGGSLRCAMLGDILAQKGVDNGWNGVVMYGCIRDACDIAEMPLGVKALATMPKKSVKKGAGEADLTVTFAQVSFKPGDWLYADEDGVVVLPAGA